MAVNRSARLNGEFRKALAEIIQNELKDPRVSGLTSVTRVSITPDLKYAKVYASVYGGPEDRKDAIAALNGAEAYLRSQLNRRIKLRRIPTLQFVEDDSIEYSIRISKLIDDVTRDLPPEEPEEEDF